MNGYSEASIVCGGNIGDPGFYLYLAKVKQKLQKILKTDREDLLIEKVERWNSVRVTFRLPPTSADILRSLAEQRPEALRNLGIQSVQVDAGRLFSLGAASARPGDSSSATFAAAAHSSSTTGVNWNQSNVDRATLATPVSSGSSGGNGGLLLTLVEASNSTGEELDNGQLQLERKRSSLGQAQQPQAIMAAKGNPHQQPAASSVQQQNLLGYLLDEPDQPTPPAPPPYQDYNQQQVGLAAGSFPPHVQQQQRWQQQQQQNTVVVAWNHHAPPTHSSANAAAGQTIPDYYYHGHQQQAPHPSAANLHQHNQYPNAANSTPAMHSRQHDSAGAMGYSSGTNSNPAFHNINYGHQQLQQNPGNVSNSPLLVGLLQQNSPPPQSSSSFMHPPTTPLLRNNNTGNLSGYSNELVADSSPPTWMPVAAPQGPVEPATKKQKRATVPKPKKTPTTTKNSTGKKTASKRAGANVSSDGNSSLDPSSIASSSFASAVSHELDNQHQQSTSNTSSAAGTPSSSFNRDTSISSVIDSVLCNVAMGVFSSGSATDVTTELKTRQSLESPNVQSKSTPSSAVPGLVDETASQCCSSPMSGASVSTIVQHQHLTNATGSPVQNPPHRQQQSVLRSVSSSSSSSSPLVAAASPTFDPQWHQRPGGITAGSISGGIPPYSAYQNQPNHQFVRHQHYPQHQESDLGVARIRRQAPPRFVHASPGVNRFQHPGLPNAPGHAYPPQTTYDLAHHDNATRIDSNAYSSTSMQPNAGKARSPAVASLNGDMYLSSPHPAAPAHPRHPLYHGQQIPQQEQYGASSSWPASVGGDNGGNGSGALAETSGYMISPKATPAVTSSGYGGADHDYLVAPSMESGGPASSFTPFANDQQQPPVVNEYYGFTSTASQQHGMYNFSTVTSRAGGAPMTPSFYNGGGDVQQMPEALVARHGSAYDHQLSTPAHWDKQQQRVARHRQPWALQQNYERGGGGSSGVYDDESMMRDMTGSVGSSPLDGFPSQQPQQSMMSTASAQQHLHNHSLAMQQQQQQSAGIDDPMLSGQVPAR